MVRRAHRPRAPVGISFYGRSVLGVVARSPTRSTTACTTSAVVVGDASPGSLGDGSGDRPAPGSSGGIVRSGIVGGGAVSGGTVAGGTVGVELGGSVVVDPPPDVGVDVV